MGLLLRIEQLRNEIKHGDDDLLKDPLFQDKVRSVLGQCGHVMEQAGLFRNPAKFEVEQLPPKENVFQPAHKVKLEIDVFEDAELADLLGYLFGIDSGLWD